MVCCRLLFPSSYASSKVILRLMNSWLTRTCSAYFSTPCSDGDSRDFSNESFTITMAQTNHSRVQTRQRSLQTCTFLNHPLLQCNHHALHMFHNVNISIFQLPIFYFTTSPPPSSKPTLFWRRRADDKSCMRFKKFTLLMPLKSSCYHRFCKTYCYKCLVIL